MKKYLLLLLLFCVPLVSGVSYYYNATGGNDANDCSTPVLSCKTIADLNTKTIAAGDTVYFACGETWREAYKYDDNSGTSGSHIIFTSYGSCNSTNQPEFAGSYNNTTWTSIGGNMWESDQTFPLTVDMIWYNTNTNLSQYGNKELTYLNVNTNWEFYYNSTSDKVRVYLSTGNPATIGNGVEIPTFDSGSFNTLWVNDQKNYIEFNNLKFTYCRDACFYNQLGNNVNFSNDIFKYSYGKGIYINGVAAGSTTSVTIKNSQFVSIGVQGVDNGATNGQGENIWIADMNNVYVYNNTLYLPHGVPINYFHTNGGVVSNNLVYDHDTDVTDWGHGIYFDGCSNILASNNIVRNCTGGFSSNSEVSGNVSRNITFYNNTGINNLIDVTVNCQVANACNYNTNISYNTFNRNEFGGLSGMNGMFLFRNFTNLTFTHNIITTNVSNNSNLYYNLVNQSAGTGIGFASDYNSFFSYYGIDNFTIGSSTYNTLRSYSAATGLDANSESTSKYYFSTSGSDTTGDGSMGNPYKTTAKMWTVMTTAGDTAYFKCGDIWRVYGEGGIKEGMPSGTAGNPMTWTSYGDCNSTNKPELRGTFNANNTSSWISIGSNLWRLNYSGDIAVAQIFANTSTSTPDIFVRVSSMAALSGNGTGYFFANYTTSSNTCGSNVTYIYSTTNPYTAFGDLEIVMRANMFVPWSNDDYHIFENMSLNYWGSTAVNIIGGDNIIIRNNDISYIGGGYCGAGCTGWAIYGNAIQIWDEGKNIDVYNNRIHDVTDAAMSPQGSSTTKHINNTRWFNNTIWDTGYGFEVFDSSYLVNTSVFGNTFYNMSSGVYQYQRSLTDETLQQRCVRIGGMNITIGFNFYNNICYESRQLVYGFAILINLENTSRYSFYNNFLWRNVSTGIETDMFRVNGSASYDYATLALFNASYPTIANNSRSGSDIRFTSLDENSPDFLVPMAGSPACSMSTSGSYVGSSPCNTYVYMSQSGSDTGDGSITYPFKTITKLNTLTLLPGDTVLFKKGDTWRLTDAYIDFANGSSSGNITYTSYGTGNRPIFLGSYNANQTGNWTNVSTGGANIWRTTFTITNDVGNIIFNNTFYIGTKKSTIGAITTQGDFFYNTSNDYTYIYSASNPASYYSNIELAPRARIMNLDYLSYVTIDGLDLRYGGEHGIGSSGTNYITVKNSYFRYIGGSYQSTNRFGNCIQIALNSSHTIIENNTLIECYDAAVTPQDWNDASGSIIHDFVTRYNIMYNCGFNFEYFNTYNATSANTSDILVEHNTIVNPGRGFNGQQSIYGIGLRLAETPVKTNNFTIKDNIIFNASYKEVELGYDQFYLWNGTTPTFDYNLYSKGSTNLVTWNKTSYTTLSAWRSARGVETHGVESNPLFMSVDINDEDFLVPSPNSPACSMSSTGSYVGALPCAETINYYFSPTGSDSNDGLTNATAWLSLSKLANIPFVGNEVVCFNTGNYNYAAQVNMYLNNVSDDVLFTTCSPGQSVNFTNYGSTYATVPNSLWTNISVNGINMWNTSYANLNSYYPIIQFENGSEFINSECYNRTYGGTCDTDYPDYFTKWNNSFYRVWANDSSNEIKIIMANGENPNNVALYISEEDSLLRIRNNNGSGQLIFRDLNFFKHRRGLYFTNSTNILVENCTFDEGYNSLRIAAGVGLSRTGNITVRYNTFIGNHYGTFYNDWIKGAMEESDPVWTDTGSAEFYVPFYVHDNLYQNTVGAISLVNTAPATMCGSQIYNNFINCSSRGCYESTFEIERYCCNSTWRNNTQYGGQLSAFSLGPANASAGKCSLIGNVILMNDSIIQNSSTTYETYAIKVYDNTNGVPYAVRNWNISHNTFKSKGLVWNSIDNAYSASASILFNMTVTNNLFLMNTASGYAVIRKTGTKANGNFWDYNSYYDSGNGGIMRYYMNETLSTQYDSLTLAKGSASWDGTWDVNSMDTNPLLDSAGIPSAGSPVCGAASDGSDIGALDCDDSCVVPYFRMNITTDTTFCAGNYTFNHTPSYADLENGVIQLIGNVTLNGNGAIINAGDYYYPGASTPNKCGVSTANSNINNIVNIDNLTINNFNANLCLTYLNGGSITNIITNNAIDHNILTSKMKNVVFDNIVVYNSNNSGFYFYGVATVDNSSNDTIKNSIFNSSDSNNCLHVNTGGASNDILITNNIFHDCVQAGDASGTYGLIYQNNTFINGSGGYIKFARDSSVGSLINASSHDTEVKYNTFYYDTYPDNIFSFYNYTNGTNIHDNFYIGSKTIKLWVYSIADGLSFRFDENTIQNISVQFSSYSSIPNVMLLYNYNGIKNFSVFNNTINLYSDGIYNDLRYTNGTVIINNFNNYNLTMIASSNYEVGNFTPETNIYLSNIGDDSNSGNILYPIQSITKLNTMLNNSQNIYFNKGDVFIGSINLTNKSNINISSYGSGNKPKIYSITNVSNWVLDTGSIYVADLNDTPTEIYINGVYIDQSHYPNNGSYLTVSSTSTNNYYLLDNELTLTEAQVESSKLRVNSKNWYIDTAGGVNYNETTHNISWLTAFSYTPQSGDKYYLHDARWMMNESSWWYNSTSKKLYLWINGSGDPNGVEVYATKGNQAILLQSSTNISINGLSISYASYEGIWMNDTRYINIINNEINNVGRRFIYNYLSYNNTIKNNIMNYSRRDGITVSYSKNTTVDGNNLSNMGVYGIPIKMYQGIEFSSGTTTYDSNNVAKNNYLVNMGYLGINIPENGVIIDRNVVSNYCIVLNDCGGIYLWGLFNGTRTISNNIVMNSASVRSLKTGDDAEGIYMDDKSGSSIIINNTVVNTVRGIYLHNSFNNSVLNNTVYNSRGYAFWMKEDTSGYPGFMKNNNISGNIFLTNSTSSYAMAVEGQYGYMGLATTNNNVYSNLYTSTPDRIIKTYNGSIYNYYNLTSWRTYSGNDSNSISLVDTYNPNVYTNITYGGELIANSNFTTGYTGWSRYPGDYNTFSIVNCTIGNECLRVEHNDSSSIDTQIIISNTFPVISGNLYNVRYKIYGNITMNLHPLVRRAGPSYEGLGYDTTISVTNESSSYNIIFVATDTQTARFDIEFNTDSAAFFIDDIYVTNITSANEPDKSDDFLFSYANNTQVTTTLNYPHKNVYGSVYISSVTLQPYTSIILYNDGVTYPCKGRSDIMCTLFGCSSTIGECSETMTTNYINATGNISGNLIVCTTGCV